MTRYTPLWEQAGSYAAAVDRRLIGALWPTAASSGCAVTVAAGTMNMNVAAGTVAAPAANNTGSVLCCSDAVEIVTSPAAPGAGSNRYDVVVCQPRGTDLDGGANNDFVFSVVSGTAAASPAVPATPAGAVALARILVAGGSASLNAANLTDVRPSTLAPPRGLLALAEVNAPQGSIGTTTVDLAGLSCTFTTPANRRIKVIAQLGFQSTVNGDYGRINLTDAVGSILQTSQMILGVSSQFLVIMDFETPAAGTLTYKLQAARTVGTGTLTMSASSVSPAFLTVEDIGAI